MSKTNNIPVKWETEDEDFDISPSSEEDREFAALLADEGSTRSGSSRSMPRPQVGDHIKARISYISNKSNDVLLDLGGKISAVIAKMDLLDSEGNFNKQVGDEVSAFVVSIKNGEYLLSTSLSQGMRNENALDTAFENHIPVKGKIAGVQKGGFTVTVMGRKAFCPVSQLSNRYIANPEEFVGKEFEFLIKSINPHNMVISRSELLQRQAETLLADLEAKCKTQEAVRGTVEEIKDFGIVVDLGGLSGLVHVSELGYGFTERPGEKYQVGDSITVKILKIEPLPGSKNIARMSLSCKALETDPWETIDQRFRVGESYQGKVIRLADFGAFVELAPGIDGLLHLSELSVEKRIRHPRDVLKVGDVISVRILELNPLSKRISLSVKALAEEPWTPEDMPAPTPHKASETGSFGELLQRSLHKSEKRDQPKK